MANVQYQTENKGKGGDGDDDSHQSSFQNFHRMLDNVPVPMRLSIITSTPLLIILALVVSDHTVQTKRRNQLIDARYHPELASKIPGVIAALYDEQNISSNYIVSKDNVNRSDVLYKRDITDAKLVELEETFYPHAKTLNLEKFFDNLNLQDLVRNRALIDSQIAIDSNDVLFMFSQQHEGLVKQMFAAVTASRDDHEELDSEYVALLTGSFATAFMRIEHACITAKLATPAGTEGEATDKKVTSAWHHYEAMRELYLDYIFTVVTPKSEKSFFGGVVNSHEWKNLLEMEHNLDGNYTINPTATTSAGQWVTDSLAGWHVGHGQLVDMLLQLNEELDHHIISTLDDVEKVITVSMDADVACMVLIAWFLIWLGAMMTLHRRNNRIEVRQRTRLLFMHDNLNRVAEYASHFSFFDLTVPQLQKDKVITQLESILMCLQGALKTVAPAITPALFPERFICQSRADGSKAPSQMEIMMKCFMPHHNQSNTSRSALISEDDTKASRAITQMEQRARLGMKTKKITALTMNTTFLHEIVTVMRENDKVGLRNVDIHLPQFIGIVETYTTQNNGMVHRLCGDRMLCAWNLAKDVTDHQVAGCRAALQITTKLRHLTNFEKMYIAAGVTSGGVVVGNVGFQVDETERHMMEEEEEEDDDRRINAASTLKQGLKSFEVFGPCVYRGTRIAHFQQLHNAATAVLCDDVIANAVHEVFAIKPLELIREGKTKTHDRTAGGREGVKSGVVRVSEIMGLRQGKQTESEIKLGKYCNAFQLFEQRKLKEAAKAFRFWTKQYGYDSSVERLQQLINDRTMIDEVQEDETLYIR